MIPGLEIKLHSSPMAALGLQFLLTESLSVSDAVLPIKTAFGSNLNPVTPKSKSTLVIAALQNSSSPQKGLTSIDFC